MVNCGDASCLISVLNVVAATLSDIWVSGSVWIVDASLNHHPRQHNIGSQVMVEGDGVG